NNDNGYLAIDGNSVLLTAAGVAAINNDQLDLQSLTVSVQVTAGDQSADDSDSTAINRVDEGPSIEVTAVESLTEESVAAGDTVATFTSSDPEGQPLTHQLLNDPHGYLAIDGNTVLLTAAGVAAINNDQLDLQSLTVSVQVTAGDQSADDSDSTAINRVDEGPSIEVTAVESLTEEAVEVGDTVATFVSSDPEGQPLSHQLLNDPHGYFQIDGNTVLLTAAGVAAINNDELDLQSLTVSVQVTAGDKSADDSDSTLLLRVDEGPQIEVTAVESLTEESVAAGDTVATFESSDPEGQPLTHQLLNDPHGYLAIDGNTVLLTAAGVAAINNDQLDLQSLSVSVQVSAGGKSADDTDSTLINRVDEGPSITVTAVESLTEESVSEGQQVATFTSSDPEGQPLSHQLLNDPNGYFQIDGNAVLLTAAGVAAINNDELDLQSLSVSVQVSAGGKSADDSDSTAINRVDEGPSIEVTAVESLTEESVAAGDTVATFVSSDPEGQPLTHQLLNNDNGYLAIDGNSVLLTAAGVAAINNDELDLQSLTVSVQVTAGDQSADDTDSTLINRVDEGPSIEVTAVESLTEESVSEGQLVATFVSSDPEGQPLTHQLLNDPHGYFQIDGNTVLLTAAGVAAINNDQLDLQSLTVSVQVTAGDQSADDSDSTAINRVDEGPSITVTAVESLTEESVSEGQQVATFVSSDPEGQPLSHQLLNDPHGYFQIDGNTVLLTAAGVAAINNDQLDLQSLSVSVQVTAGDQSADDSDSTAINRVDEGPSITVTAVESLTEESVSEGQQVATFTSSDPEGQPLSHQLLNDPHGYFQIDGNAVLLTAAGVAAINNDQLDLQSLSVSVQVTAGDQSADDSDSTAINRVDEGPSITVTAVESLTEESVAAGDTVATFESSDPEGQPLTHQLLNDPNGYFQIDGNTVLLTAAGVAAINNDQLDLQSLSVSVQVSAGGKSADDTDSTLINRVDEGPSITVTAVESLTEESVSEGQQVATFTSSDPEGQPLSHQLLNDPNGYFQIDGNAVLLTAAGVAAINNDELDLQSLSV
ncbi:hypothetical protein, partial [Marinobacterium arenosum]|uniref:hypothetical protein n=1 Tax=Marinobacterium arenosum TaxID=2862496 RepID=UPI001C967307